MRLKKITFAEIEERYKVLNTIELDEIIGGDGRTDCFYKCMETIGTNLIRETDPKGSIREGAYEDYYKENYDAKGGEGVKSEHAQSLFGDKFEIYGENVGENGYTFQQTKDALSDGAQVIGAYNTEDGNPHAIILKSYNGEFGSYEYYDPQSGETGYIHASSINFAIGTKKKK